MEIVIEQLADGKMNVADFVESLSEHDAKMLLGLYINFAKEEKKDNVS